MSQNQKASKCKNSFIFSKIRTPIHACPLNKCTKTMLIICSLAIKIPQYLHVWNDFLTEIHNYIAAEMLYIKVHIDYIFPVFSCQKVIFFEFEDRSQEHETNKFSQQKKTTSQPIKLSVTSTANQIVYITLIAYTTYKVIKNKYSSVIFQFICFFLYILRLRLIVFI